jgi:hypothetical protein
MKIKQTESKDLCILYIAFTRSKDVFSKTSIANFRCGNLVCSDVNDAEIL